MQKFILYIPFIILINSCSSVKPIDDFPIKPELKQYTKAPIVGKQDANFVVTDELILNSTLLTDYSKRIDTWKLKKNVR